MLHLKELEKRDMATTVDKEQEFREFKESEWYLSRPQIIKDAINLMPPHQHYMIRATGHQCHIISYGEDVKGRLDHGTYTVQKTGIALDQERADAQPEELKHCAVGDLYADELSVWGTETEVTPDKRNNCKDCGKDTMVDDKDYYMVKHQVWNKYGLGEGEDDEPEQVDINDGMLCMDCMETRIGRKLEFDDLLPCPLNGVLNPYTKNIIDTYFKEASDEFTHRD
jgi:hypothetical protein